MKPCELLGSGPHSGHLSTCILEEGLMPFELHIHKVTLVVSGVTAIWCALWGTTASATMILTDSSVIQIPENAVGSGNGTLDFILFTESSGGTGNSSGSFNGDNANTHLPTGSGHTTANESFVTSIG